MKRIKKVLLMLLLLMPLLFAYNVKADEALSVESIKQVENEFNVEFTVVNNHEANVKYENVGDTLEFDVVIKNNASDQNVILKDLTILTEVTGVDYTAIMDQENLELKPSETRTIRVTGILTDQASDSEDVVKIQLHYNLTDKPCPDCDKPLPVNVNPGTGDTINLKILLLLLCVVGLLLAVIVFKKMHNKKMSMLMLVLMLGMIMYPINSVNGDNNYALEIILNQKIQLNKIPDTITFTKLSTSYTGSPVEPTFSSTSNTEVTPAYYSDELCQNPIEGKPVNVGEYYATATSVGNVYYSPGELECSDVLTITKAAPSCPEVDDVTTTYDGEAHTLTIGEGLVGGILNYSLNDGEWTDTLPSVTEAGTYNIKIMVVGDESHEDTFCKNVELKINKAIDTITMTEVESPYTGSSVEASFSNISSTPITATYYSDDSCSSEITGAPVNAGIYYATATSAGNNNYKSANLSCTKAVTITKIDSTCPSITDTTVYYDGAAHTLTIGEGLDGGTLNYKLNDGEWTSEAISVTNAGTYSIQTKVVGDVNHDDKSCGTNTITINKLDDAITMTEVESPYTGSSVEPTFSNLSNTTITPKYYDDNACSNEISGKPINPGIYYATATSEGNEMYNPASLACTKAVTITKLDDTISFNEVIKTYDGEEATVTFRNLSDTNITSAFYSDSTCETPLEGNPVNVGEYYATASSAGNEIYNPANLACTKAVTINPAASTCPTITNVDVVYDSQSHTLDVGSGLVGGTLYYSVNNGEWTTTIPSATDAGLYTINTKVVGDGNHSDADCGTNTINISQLSAMIMTTNQTKVYDGTPLVATNDCEFVGTYDGFNVTCTNNGSITDVGEAPKTIDTVTITKDNVDVTSNFYIAKTERTLTVTKAASVCPTITNVEVTYDGAAHSLNIGSGLDGGTLNYSLDGGSWTVTNPSVTNVGSYTVESKVVADNNHTDTNCGSNTIKINKIEDTITSTLVESTYTGSPVAGNFTNLSNTQIEVTYYSDSSCSSAMNGLPTNVGDYYATATSEGNNIYTSASLACTKSVTITKAESTCPALGDITITFDGNAHSITVGSGLDGGTLNYKLDNGQWTDVLPTVVNVGVYSVQTKVVGDSNHNNKSCGTNTITIEEIPKLDDLITIQEVESNYTGSPIGANFSNLSQSEIVPTYYSDNSCSSEIDGSPVNVGVYYATAVSEGNEDYNSAELACSKAVTINKSAAVCPTITNVEVTYDGAAHSLNIGSGLVGGTMSYSVDGGSWTGTLPSKTNAGTYSIDSKVVGDNNHTDTTCGTNSIVINKINDVITANVVEETYTGSSIGGNFTNLSNTEITPTYYSDSLCSDPVGGEPTEAGEYYATATSNGNDNYTAASLACTKSVIINRAAATCPTITDTEATYDGDEHGLTVGDDYSGGSLLFSIDGESWTDNAPAAIDAGYYEVETMISGDSNHSDTECGTNSIQIYKKSVTIVTSDQSKEYDGSELYADDDCDFGTSLDGFSVSCSNSGSITDAGTEPKVIEYVTIYDSSYEDATNNFNITTVNGTLTVTPSPTAYMGECINPEYDESIYDGYEKTIISSGNEVNYSIDTATNAGDYEITVTTNPNYAFEDGTTEKTITCSIRKRPITIYPKNQDIKYGTEISKTIADIDFVEDYSNPSGLASDDEFHSITLTQTRTEVYSMSDEGVEMCDRAGSGEDPDEAYGEWSSYSEGLPESCLGITPSNAVIYNSNNEDVTNNYDITYHDGTLLIHYELKLETGENCDGFSGVTGETRYVNWYYKEFSLYSKYFDETDFSNEFIITIQAYDGYAGYGIKKGNNMIQTCVEYETGGDGTKCNTYNPSNVIITGNETFTTVCADKVPPAEIQLTYGEYYSDYVSDHDFKVGVSTSDIGSGVAKVELYYRKCGDSNYTKVEQTFNPVDYFSQDINVNACLNYGNYYGYVVVTDAAGNETRSEDFEITLEKPTAEKVLIDNDSLGTSCKTLDCAINELFKYYTGNYGGE